MESFCDDEVQCVSPSDLKSDKPFTNLADPRKIAADCIAEFECMAETFHNDVPRFGDKRRRGGTILQENPLGSGICQYPCSNLVGKFSTENKNKAAYKKKVQHTTKNRKLGFCWAIS